MVEVGDVVFDHVDVELRTGHAQEAPERSGCDTPVNRLDAGIAPGVQPQCGEHLGPTLTVRALNVVLLRLDDDEQRRTDFRELRRATDEEITGIIRRVYERYHYIVDPHTACAFKDLNPVRTSVVLATAHPAKFPDTIRAATGVIPTHPALEALKARPIVKHRLPADAAAIKSFIAKHAV